ncbi:MAG: GNAT family N-acetyltransferase [Rhodobacteraceae bacterium]|nr:GNAT family N-acetyltransferase [Paracoccaceae bacterium]
MDEPSIQLAINIRPLLEGDREAWGALWKGYLDYYETELPPEMYDIAFNRMRSGNEREFHGLVAERDGELIGLAHYLFHRHGWKVEPVIYLQDLYVSEAARGTGAGRALIEAVYEAADAAGSASVYWLTQDFNETARKLYDRVAMKTPFIKYQR